MSEATDELAGFGNRHERRVWEMMYRRKFGKDALAKLKADYRKAMIEAERLAGEAKNAESS